MKDSRVLFGLLAVGFGVMVLSCGTITQSAEPAAAVPLVVRKSEVAASGVPEASALVPAGWHGTARDIPVLAPIDARTMASTGLACAMIAVAVGIGLSLRARPVHVN
mgnify:CR=1 FL=1